MTSPTAAFASFPLSFQVLELGVESAVCPTSLLQKERNVLFLYWLDGWALSEKMLTETDNIGMLVRMGSSYSMIWDSIFQKFNIRQLKKMWWNSNVEEQCHLFMGSFRILQSTQRTTSHTTWRVIAMVQVMWREICYNTFQLTISQKAQKYHDILNLHCWYWWHINTHHDSEFSNIKQYSLFSGSTFLCVSICNFSDKYL